MTEKKQSDFSEQGGAATMDPSPLLRWITSKVLNRASNIDRQEQQRQRQELIRVKNKQAHIIDYFHQVEDGYSALAAQCLTSLRQRYDVEIRCHLVTTASADNTPEPQLLSNLSCYDAALIAPYYGLAYSKSDAATPQLIALANSILAAQNDDDAFINCITVVSKALHDNEAQQLALLATQYGSANTDATQLALNKGNALREKLGHYSGAMFHYGREWYWGVDRLYHLEQRLAQLDADKNPSAPLLMPRPNAIPDKIDASEHGLTLEIYVSLRSPYTAISFDRTVELCKRSEVKLIVHPVLPMVMRGVPATRQKGMYIFKDTAREAKSAGVSYGNFYDPIGEPVRRCYSLYPWACQHGRGNALISAFLKSAFTLGINTNNDKGLQKVVEAAGLDWTEALNYLGDNEWQNIVEHNRQQMYNAGLWGVPSFRLLDKEDEEIVAVWGQDRLWLIAKKIEEAIKANA